MSIATAGIATRSETDTWSLGKIRLWSALIDEQQHIQHLELAAAVWEPKRISGEITRIGDELSRISGSDPTAGQWEPASRDRLMGRIQANHQPLTADA